MTNKLTTINADLFSAPKEAILVHACNAQGVWGAGIAKEFKTRFPHSYKQYQIFCKQRSPQVKAGGILLSQGHIEESHYVASLITSNGYGRYKDSENLILAQTTLALWKLFVQATAVAGSEPLLFWSPKFNSGLFGVPWEKTEEILKMMIERLTHKTEWVVCQKK